LNPRTLLGPAAVITAAGLLGVALPAQQRAATPPARGPLPPPQSQSRGWHRPGEPVRSHRPRPVSLEIPAIGVRARLVPLGLNADGTLEVPARFDDAGWWAGGSRPGERGPAVVAGHVDSRTGPAVFFRLSQLRAGDRIAVVRRDGSRVHFVVRRTERFPKARFPTARVYGATRAATLRVITCSGAFDRASGHYLDNTVVFATRR
jgi:sortase (surface protein transpeptidase)